MHRMSLYSFVAGLHVIVAVGGLGQLVAVPLIAGNPEWGSIPLLKRLLRGASGSLVVMLLTGLWLLGLEGWTFTHAGWFSLSMLLFLAMGAFLGIASGTIKKIDRSGMPFSKSPMVGKLRTLTMLASIALVLIVFLMEAKPF